MISTPQIQPPVIMAGGFLLSYAVSIFISCVYTFRGIMQIPSILIFFLVI